MPHLQEPFSFLNWIWKKRLNEDDFVVRLHIIQKRLTGSNSEYHDHIELCDVIYLE